MALPSLVFTLAASVNGDSLTISLDGWGNRYQGFDKLVLTSIPELGTIGLFGFTELFLRCRRS